ncbi:MFS transporter [Nocardioides islandensis]|jgi:MFS family permease|uniref:MFS transporter n=1 Tax=Nocardioides islandensis TaxID=433663 RepID=A0A930VGK4_9ACTN|nr:MFS transporter [Nocardioides islandensis]MBF4763540.1 MFS transporter [Nocardioides islandensis]
MSLGEQRDFRLFWTAETVSGFGSYVTTLAIQVLVVVTLHESAAGVGLVNAARFLPYLVLGLVVGVLVDRVRRRPILVATDLGRGLLLVAIPLLAMADQLTLALLVVFMVAFGTLSLLNDSASQSFVPRLVPRPLLTRANARLDQSDAVAQTSGPALAGGLVALLSAPWAVLVDAASFLASALLVARTRVAEPPSRSVDLRSMRQVPTELREGLRWVYRHRTLTPFAIGTHIWFLFNAMAGAALPVFALRQLDLGALGFGLLLALAGVGAVVGSSYAERLGNAFGAGRVSIACIVGNAVAWALVASSPGDSVLTWAVFGAGQLLLGVSMGAENANTMGYRQSVTPDELQGRMNTTMRSINRAMVVVGAPLGGLLADSVGLRPVLYVAAAGFLLVAAGLALTPFRDARIPQETSVANPNDE